MFLIYINEYSCWDIDYYFGMSVFGIGEVKDGIECGLDLFCLERKCVFMLLWEKFCMFIFCNNKGLCNSKYYCYCNEYWFLFKCLNKGFGGSIDSGFFFRLVLFLVIFIVLY